MATITSTPGYTFITGETVEANDLNLLGSPTIAISNIVNADIGSGAAIEASKLAATLDLSAKTVTLPAASVGATALASNAVTTAKINNAAVTAAKLDGAQTGSAPIFACRAWVNFSATRDASDSATLALTNRLIRSSGNVTSVLRNGVGDFTITFTTAMPNANYAVIATALHATTVTGAFIAYELNAASRSATQVRIAVGDNQIDQFFDPSYGVAVAVFA
jgi:hypothetical protein